MSTPGRLVRSAACSLVLLVALTACGDAFHRPAAIVHGVSIGDDEVAATVPVARVLSAFLRQSCGTQTAGEPPRSPCLRYTIGLLIERQIVRAYAVAHDIRVRPYEVQRSVKALEQQLGPDQVRQVLGQYGLPESGFEGLVREQLLKGKVQRAVAAAAIPESELRAAYERDKPQFTQIHVAHIQLPNRQQAERISKEVTPENFADLAKKYSTEKGSAANGGDIGTVPIGQLPPDFVAAALSLQPGEIGKPVHTGLGWEIIRLISSEIAPYSSVRPQLQQELQGPALERWYRGQFDNGVEVNPRYGRVDPQTLSVIPLDTTATALPSPSPS
ncbi:MAG TPA: peptidylprolyl isomerase [Actinomycetota bacterium]|nr:peptidylprolyl isomerase [Actinomycetota bacterium]